MIITGKYPNLRLRRNRNSDWSRRLVRENTLSVNDLILPIFLVDGKNKKQPIKTMPDISQSKYLPDLASRHDMSSMRFQTACLLWQAHR